MNTNTNTNNSFENAINLCGIAIMQCDIALEIIENAQAIITEWHEMRTERSAENV